MHDICESCHWFLLQIYNSQLFNQRSGWELRSLYIQITNNHNLSVVWDSKAWHYEIQTCCFQILSYCEIQRPGIMRFKGLVFLIFKVLMLGDSDTWCYEIQRCKFHEITSHITIFSKVASSILPMQLWVKAHLFTNCIRMLHDPSPLIILQIKTWDEHHCDEHPRWWWTCHVWTFLWYFWILV